MELEERRPRVCEEIGGYEGKAREKRKRAEEWREEEDG